ncbi:MAG: hypothetical protein IJB26_05100 [Clostridia bacterium]|nr:hypothetical protein [Clostridia bacterium]
MFIRTFHKRSIRYGCVAALFFGIAALMLYWPQALANGVSRGLSVCSTVIIPTLYPFMILSGVLTDSPLCTQPPRFFGALTRRLFRLPPCCGAAILMSLIGGYPAGALAIGRLYHSGQINVSQARRMTLFCVNGGPGFIVSTVGVGLLGSARAGWLLFAAHAATSIGMGLTLARTAETQEESIDAPRLAATARPIAAVVQDTCGALLTMCGFVLLASAVLSVWEASGVSLWLQRVTGHAATAFSAAVSALIEVSCGCIALAGNGRMTPFWLCLCLGWGGLSVQGQLAVALRDPTDRVRLLTPPFWFGRLLHGIISGGVAVVLFHFIPVDLPTAGQNVSTVPFYTSAAASVMLVLFSFIAMLCFYPKKTGNISQGML